jgi:hypothetical protein
MPDQKRGCHERRDQPQTVADAVREFFLSRPLTFDCSKRQIHVTYTISLRFKPCWSESALTKTACKRAEIGGQGTDVEVGADGTSGNGRKAKLARDRISHGRFGLGFLPALLA